MNLDTLASLILLLGFFISLFYGFKAVWIFMYPSPDRNPKKHTKSWWMHQIWINFAGSFIGWVCIYVLIISFGADVKASASSISFGHVFLFIVGLLGVMGFLPLTLWGIANSMKYISEKVTGKI